MAVIMKGKEVSEAIKEDLKKLTDSFKRTPELIVIQVGDDPASNVYIRNKARKVKELGFAFCCYQLGDPIMGDPIDEQSLIGFIESIQAKGSEHYSSASGIIVQLPLPKSINESKVLNSIKDSLDVDCLTETNLGRLYSGNELIAPCTAKGVIDMLKYYKIPMTGKKAVVIGRSNIVGKPVAYLLSKENATVTVCHSKTPKETLIRYCKDADIVVSAVGIPKFVTADMIKEGATVIDVGINRDENNKLCGDVDFDNVKEVAGYITPVPGGVGVMTVMELMRNIAILHQESEKQTL